jgi:CHAD domain-containing protein
MDESKDTMLPAPSVATLHSVPALPQDRGAARHQEEWKKLRELAQKQLDRFVSFEPNVLRGDDPDAIHDMRVASRRLQQILDLIYLNPRPREVRRLRRRIRRCRRALGDVRNCDVLLRRVKLLLARKRSSRREAWTAIDHFLRARRSESFLKAMRKLSKVNLAVFYVHMRECLASVGSNQDSGQDAHDRALPELPAAEPFPERLAEALTGIWNAFQEQIALSHRDQRAPVIHGARIAAKRLRYLLEVVHAFDVPGSAEALTWLRSLQQQLGDWHDLEILEQMMTEMIARPAFLRDHLPLAMDVEKLILRNRGKKKAFQEMYYQMTRDSAELRRLKGWVDYLLASPSAAFARA